MKNHESIHKFISVCLFPRSFFTFQINNVFASFFLDFENIEKLSFGLRAGLSQLLTVVSSDSRVRPYLSCELRSWELGKKFGAQHGRNYGNRKAFQRSLGK